MMDVKKTINTNIGLVIICLFSAVCVWADFIIIDKALDKYVHYRSVEKKEEGLDINEEKINNDEVIQENNGIDFSGKVYYKSDLGEINCIMNDSDKCLLVDEENLIIEFIEKDEESNYTLLSIN